MRGLIRLIEALILGGSVGTKFVFGSSVVRLQPVVNGGCSLHEPRFGWTLRVPFPLFNLVVPPLEASDAPSTTIDPCPID